MTKPWQKNKWFKIRINKFENIILQMRTDLKLVRIFFGVVNVADILACNVFDVGEKECFADLRGGDFHHPLANGLMRSPLAS